MGQGCSGCNNEDKKTVLVYHRLHSPWQGPEVISRDIGADGHAKHYATQEKELGALFAAPHFGNGRVQKHNDTACKKGMEEDNRIIELNYTQQVQRCGYKEVGCENMQVNRQPAGMFRLVGAYDKRKKRNWRKILGHEGNAGNQQGISDEKFQGPAFGGHPAPG